ncbi:AAA family ATPase [Bacillus sp. FJAT-49705]|uniref:AAA family ATPase n=1 Tax=Cytobacillus citreus TaxID=2833586 RepID=A0ABS5NZM5_9BACI|nr:AAA family ATPase [Cytobacillus citreus]MBS4193286.1 AAA family ATPase [Cytobacillus citreus]
MSADIKILLTGDQEQSKTHLRGVLNSFEKVDMISYRDLKTELDRLAPDLIFLIESDKESPADAIEYIHAVNPMALVVFIAFSQNFDVLKSVMRAGIIDFFVLPDESAMLYGRLDSIVQMVVQRKKQLMETAVSSQSFKRGRGKIYSFYSGKGGSGKTLISSAFAQTLKFESTAQVIFIDLNLHYGGAEAFLSIVSNRSFADLMPVIDELNESHIRNVSQVEQLSKLEVLLSPRDAEVAEHLPEGFIARLLRTCRRSYDFVVVDLPVAMNIHSYAALEESDKIYYVLNLDTPSINTLKQVEGLFRRLGIETEGRLEILINQVGKENEIKPNDVKSIISYPIAAKLPRDFKGVQAHINKSEPFRKEPNEKKLIPFAKGIRKWVVQMVE